MGLSPEDPTVGGIVLRKPAIQSPDYVAGTSGWSIKIDGSAEFNSLNIRGTFNGTDFLINSSGAFFYSGTPALGNLIASLAAAAGTDAEGNAYEAGVTAYVSVSGSIYAVQLGTLAAGLSGFAALTLQNLTSPADIPAAVLAKLSSSGCTLEVFSGQSTALATPAALALEDSVQTGGNPAAAFSANTNVTAGSFNGVPLAQVAAVTDGSANSGTPATPQSTANLYNWAGPLTANVNLIRTALNNLISAAQSSGWMA